MGFFSWKTSDTDRSIPSCYSVKSTFPVYVITEDGQYFKEENYEGYGVFGGKDIFVLLAELNGFKGKDDFETRDMFFEKIWRRGIRKGDKVYYHGDDFSKYDNVLKSEGKCPNDLVSEDGWNYFGDSGEFEYWNEQGWKMVKIVEELPSKKNWKKVWNSLPFPQGCEYQGFFYECDDKYEEDEE